MTEGRPTQPMGYDAKGNQRWITSVVSENSSQGRNGDISEEDKGARSSAGGNVAAAEAATRTGQPNHDARQVRAAAN